MLFQQDNLTVRRLRISDAHLLAKWLSDPAVLEWYEGRDNAHDLEKVQAVFFKKMGDGLVQGCIIEWSNRPVGYVQFYPLEAEERNLYGYAADERVYGTDQFLGEPDCWNQGIGTKLVTAMADWLVREQGASKVVMDPQARNERAIRCYEKCGFAKVKLMPQKEMHEGVRRDCWLMEYNGREALEKANGA